MFPPTRDISSAAWEDVNAPGGALHLGTSRAVSIWGDESVLLASTDIGGIGIKYVDRELPWQTLNGGYGQPGIRWPTIWDVAGVGFDSNMFEIEIFALGGNPHNEGEVIGGLWYSSDSGTSWEVLATSLEDGIAMSGRDSDCGSGSRAGGQYLVPDADVEQLWIASNHYHTTYDLDTDTTRVEDFEVYLYDETEGLCDDPVVDLPDGQFIGAIVRASTANYWLAPEEPALVVGYRASNGGPSSLYVCELPSTAGLPDLGCTDVPAITCAAVAGSEGLDVKDLEVDPLDPTVVYVADGGDDPDVGAGECAGYNGPHVWVLDLVGTPSIADIADPTWAASYQGVTGVSMDPSGSYLFAFNPQGSGIFRMPRADVLAGSTSDWEQLLPPYTSADGAERQVTHAANVDHSGGWYENSRIVTPYPFPELYAPTGALDAAWYVDHSGTVDEVHAVLSGLEDMWDVTGLDIDNMFFDPERDTYWTVWPEPDVDLPHDFQTMGGYDIALDHEQNLWVTSADKGLYVIPAPGYDYMGPWTDFPFERDCLMELTDAGGNSVSVGLDGSVWGTLFQQGTTEVPHRIYVLRTVHDDPDDLRPLTLSPDGIGDGNEWTWTYQGAGVVNLNSRFSGSNRLRCRNYDDPDDPRHDSRIDKHYAVPMDGDGGGFAFTRDPDGYNGGLTGPYSALASWGNPYAVVALDRNIAVVSFDSYEGLHASGTIDIETIDTTYTQSGTLAYTLDGGATWAEVSVKSGPIVGTSDTKACAGTDSSFFGGVNDLSLIRPGTESYWKDVGSADGVFDPATDDWQLSLLISSRNSAECNLARVVIDATGDSWEWYDLPETTDYANPCRVLRTSIGGVAASPWTNTAFVWANYAFTSLNPPTAYTESGGACSVNLDTGSVGVVLSPESSVGEYELDVTEVVPNPNVMGTLLLSTSISVGSTANCVKLFTQGYSSTDVCPTLAPALIATSGGGGWSIAKVPGIPAALTALDAEWAPLTGGVGDDETVFYYTAGPGTWKATLEW